MQSGRVADSTSGLREDARRRLDRLGRTLLHLLEILEDLMDRGITLRVLDGLGTDLNLATSQGRLFVQMQGAFAEFERNLIRERVVAGLVAARARGHKGGRRPKLSPEQQQHAAQMAHGGMPITAIAQTLGCSRHTVYKALKPAGVDA